MYKVIGTVKSRAFRVLWMLEELGQSYEIVPAPPASDLAKSFNPLGKIPALVDGDTVLTDSVAIMTYLADKHQMLTAPAGTPERAKQDAMTLWLVDEMDALLWTYTKHSFIIPEGDRLQNVGPALQAEYTKTCARIEEMLDSAFLMGDDITVPDLLAVHCMGWAHGVGFPPLGPKGKAYMKACRARPAFRAAGAHAT